MDINELLVEKFNNYTNFIRNSTLSPSTNDKLLGTKATLNDVIVRIYALSQTYAPFLSSDGLEINKYTEYWLNKYKKNKNDINSEDYQKFQNYHLMFFDLMNKYLKK